jgi:putative hydrolase of the HAD superfamily
MQAALAREDQLDQANDWRTSEQREFQRWQATVTNVFRESPRSEEIFQTLYNWFALPEAWKISPHIGPLIELLKDRAIPFGLASNFDGRLRGLVQEMADLHPFKERLFISSEMGHRKPGKEFFRKLIEREAVEPSEILFVGDDPRTDEAGAKSAGLKVLLIDRHSTDSSKTLLDVAESLGHYNV